MHLLQLLYPGTIKRLFRVQPKAEVKPYEGPLAIPLDPIQCVHVEVDMQGEGVSYNRCKSVVEKDRNGWLCSMHQRMLDHMVRIPIKTREQLENEIIASIILTDRKLILAGTRVDVPISKNLAVHYLEYQDHDPVESRG